MFVYYFKMQNGDVHNIFTDQQMNPGTDLKTQKWIKYQKDEKTVFINIAQISSITMKEIHPPERDE